MPRLGGFRSRYVVNEIRSGVRGIEETPTPPIAKFNFLSFDGPPFNDTKKAKKEEKDSCAQETPPSSTHLLKSTRNFHLDLARLG